MASNYTIKEGKLYCNNELANIEFGNTDLINFIKRENERIEMIQSSEGFEIDISVETLYKAEGDFKCICGNKIWLESEEDDEDDAIKALVGSKKCRKCDQEYEIVQGSDGEIIAHLKPSK